MYALTHALILNLYMHVLPHVPILILTCMCSHTYPFCTPTYILRHNHLLCMLRHVTSLILAHMWRDLGPAKALLSVIFAVTRAFWPYIGSLPAGSWMLDFGVRGTGWRAFGDGEGQVKGNQALVSLGLLGPSEAYKSLAYETLVF